MWRESEKIDISSRKVLKVCQKDFVEGKIFEKVQAEGFGCGNRRQKRGFWVERSVFMDMVWWV